MTVTRRRQLDALIKAYGVPGEGERYWRPDGTSLVVLTGEVGGGYRLHVETYREGSEEPSDFALPRKEGWARHVSDAVRGASVGDIRRALS